MNYNKTLKFEFYNLFKIKYVIFVVNDYQLYQYRNRLYVENIRVTYKNFMKKY